MSGDLSRYVREARSLVCARPSSWDGRGRQIYLTFYLTSDENRGRFRRVTLRTLVDLVGQMVASRTGPPPSGVAGIARRVRP